MAYDSRRQRVVRFGGWDGTTWSKVAESGPEPRNHAAMAFDEARSRVVLVGGHEGSIVFGDVWEWNGATWSRITACSPRKRSENGHCPCSSSSYFASYAR
jgi:hypothetical protein